MSTEASPPSRLGERDQVAETAAVAYRRRGCWPASGGGLCGVRPLAGRGAGRTMRLVFAVLAGFADFGKQFGFDGENGLRGLIRFERAASVLLYLLSLLTVVFPCILAAIFYGKLATRLGVSRKWSLLACIVLAIAAVTVRLSLKLSDLPGHSCLMLGLVIPRHIGQLPGTICWLFGTARQLVQFLVPLVIGWWFLHCARDPGRAAIGFVKVIEEKKGAERIIQSFWPFLWTLGRRALRVAHRLSSATPVSGCFFRMAMRNSRPRGRGANLGLGRFAASDERRTAGWRSGRRQFSGLDHGFSSVSVAAQGRGRRSLSNHNEAAPLGGADQQQDALGHGLLVEGPVEVVGRFDRFAAGFDDDHARRQPGLLGQTAALHIGDDHAVVGLEFQLLGHFRGEGLDLHAEFLQSRGLGLALPLGGGAGRQVGGLFGQADFQLDPLAVAEDGQRLVVADGGLLDDRLEFLGRGDRLAGELR